MKPKQLVYSLIILIIGAIACGHQENFELEAKTENPFSTLPYPSADFAYYAIQYGRWNCQESFNAAMRYPSVSLSFVHNSFCYDWNGHDMQCSTACLKKFVDTGKVANIDIHLINEVCIRNKNCLPREFLYGLTRDQYKNLIMAHDVGLYNALRAYFKKAAELYLPICAKTKCRISVGLESNLSQNQYKWVAGRAAPYFPGKTIIWNPVINNPNGAAPIKGFAYESHGYLSPMAPSLYQVYNLDGADVGLSSMKQWRKRYAIGGSRAYVWTPAFNCLAKLGWKPVNQRTDCPTGQKFLDIANTMNY